MILEAEGEGTVTAVATFATLVLLNRAVVVRNISPRFIKLPVV